METMKLKEKQFSSHLLCPISGLFFPAMSTGRIVSKYVPFEKVFFA